RLFYEGRKEELVLTWHRMVRKTSMCLYPIFVFFVLNASDFIRLIYSDKYEGSASVFRIYLFLLLVRISDNTAMVRACDATPIMLKASVLVFVSNLTLSLVLLKTIGFLGPAVGTVMAIYVNFAYIISRLRSLLGLSIGGVMPWRYLLRVLVISALCGASVLPLTHVVGFGILSLLIKGLTFTGLYLVLATWAGILEQADWELVRRYTGFDLLWKRHGQRPGTGRPA
ncbi:MAG: polysaccharide biosynthesis C-terminal domain-containing protein, partial [Deltaproteobacteria bacterium]|nr:polysaccharide biosynthesis C-terminal domain-containing protein [Deltaproteobacteria bacterium]